MQKKRPNIILITSDQQRADCNGFENPEVRTPHLDQLARDGTRFSACMTPNLVCQPSRASILTGMLPLTHGVWDNGVDLEPRIGENGFAGTLARNGYHSAFIGKAHFSTKATFAPTGTPECNKSQAKYGPDWYGPYMGFEHVELSVFGHMHRTRPLDRPAMGHYERWFLSRGKDEEAVKLWAASTRPELGTAQTWHSALPVAWHNSSWIGDRAIDHLSHHDKTKPLAMWVSFPDPHHPFDCPEPWSLMYDPKSLTLPKHRKPDLERRPWWHKASLESTPQLKDPEMLKFRAAGSRVPPQTDAQLADMTANYYGMISLIDHNVGRILEALDKLGLTEDTLVFYSTDHGDMLGNHGLYLKGPTPYEDLMRVTMIARGPGIAAGKVINEPVGTLDLAATFYDYAGITAPHDMQSRSLAKLLAGKSETRDAAYSEWHVHPSRCGVALQLRTVRTRTHKCTFELGSGAGELYDLYNDPGEMDNLFNDPGRAKIRKELHDMMRARPGKIRDDLAEPVGMA
ncbi:MAG: sulfatase-like hydrolase/transferase [Burkholderiales bacterium]|jgi:arylsulfatase A-like enzyme|nr:sulfatase-like hydrolase/transferase [Burkholderiales bacterium]